MSTQLIDLVIAATLIEWAALTMLWHRKQRGLPPTTLAWMLLPGLCLMLAVRYATLGMAWHWIALLMSAAGLAHAIDVKQRWRR